jgi:hypothetical protein
MSKHFAKCPQRQEQIAAAEQSARKPEDLIHLRVQDAYARQFWLDLEVRASAKLKDVDAYLRAIWLECCGHLSEFTTGSWPGQEIAMSKRVAMFDEDGVQLLHIYDFGTSSETLITRMGGRRGIPLTKHPMQLMARNIMPKAECIECGQPASHLCMECLIEEQIEGTLCDQHAETHPHEDYGELIPLVNSPRVGMCGYFGPADPPY